MWEPYAILAFVTLVTVSFAAILYRAGLLVPWGQRGAGWSGFAGVLLVGCACLTVTSFMSGSFATFPATVQVMLLLGSLVFAVLWHLASRRNRSRG